MKRLKTSVKSRVPIVTLKGDNSYNDKGFNNEIYMQDLLDSEVGTIFSSYNGGLRDSIEETATVVFKRDDGLALLIDTVTATDEPNPVVHKEEQLIWITF